MKKSTRVFAFICVVAVMISLLAIPASAAYEPEPGDVSVPASAVSGSGIQPYITETAGKGTVHYNTLTNKTWGESYAYQWGGTSYMYVYCLVTANDGTSKSDSNSKSYNGSDVERSLTTSKLSCSSKAGRHTYTKHIITGSWNGTETYYGNVDW